MRGGVAFRRSKVPLYLLSGIFHFFPEFILRFIWSVSSPFSGGIALGLRYSILKARAKAVGENVYVGENVVLKNLSELVVGSNVSIHAGCYIDAYGGCRIGSGVSIAHGSSILTANHTWDNPSLPIKYNPLRAGAVVIEDDVWIGCGVRVLPGVTLSTRCVVAAGAVVINDVPHRTLWGGVPARFLKVI